MRRIRTILRRLLRRAPETLPVDPFGDPGGPVATKQTPDSVAFSQLPINQGRIGL